MAAACENTRGFVMVFSILMNSRLIRGVLVGTLLLGCAWLAQDVRLPVSDSVEYWAAARLALDHQNPYNAEALLALEREAGYSRKSPLVMWNPPWILPVLLPLAVFSYPAAEKLWLVLGCASVALSVSLLWRLYGRTRYPSPAAGLLIAIFTPLLVGLAIGQVGPLVLLGITGFLWFERKQRFGLAGVSLFFLALKPHLVFLLWIALGFWTVKKRNGRTLSGLLATVVAVSLVTVASTPRAFGQYYNFWIHHPVRWSEFPTVPGILGHLTGSQSVVLVLIPPALASLWLMGHWARYRGQWNWQDELPILLVVSLVASPYAWFFDGVILLPALIQIITIPLWKKNWRVLMVAYAATNLAVVLLIATGKNLFWYAWVAPMWLVLYLGSRRLAGNAGGRTLWENS